MSLGTDVQDTSESVKHYLWHGNVDAALESLESLSFDLEIIRRRLAVDAKLPRSVTEFETYVQNNHAFIPNFGERYRHRDTITTAFVESTINQAVSKRFVKRQQIPWTPDRAHSLLQTRTRGLNGDSMSGSVIGIHGSSRQRRDFRVCDALLYVLFGKVRGTASQESAP